MRFGAKLWRVPSVAGALLLAGACATTSTSTAPAAKLFKQFVAAYEAALEAHDVEPPTQVKTVSDVRLYAKVHALLAACVPGRAPEYSISWSQDYAGRTVHTSQGDKTLGELVQACNKMFDELDKKPVASCGARYVKLERKLRDDDAYGRPRIAKTSDGWYMTPCESAPGTPLGKEMKDLEPKLRAACADPKASLYVLSPWAEDDERSMTATVACISPRQERPGWLPGNPGLGLK